MQDWLSIKNVLSLQDNFCIHDLQDAEHDMFFNGFLASRGLLIHRCMSIPLTIFFIAT